MKTFHNCFGLALAAALAITATPLLANVVLREGDNAPMVSGRDQDGNKWNLKSKIGKEIVLLYFYPKDDTMGCTTEACGLRDKMVDLKRRDVEVLASVSTTPPAIKNSFSNTTLNFPLLSDTKEGEITDALESA